jgi:hypothetical protein
MQEALPCRLDGYVGFHQNFKNSVMPYSGKQNKAKHLNTFEVTETFTVGFWRYARVNERYRYIGSRGAYRYNVSVRDDIMQR